MQDKTTDLDEETTANISALTNYSHPSRNQFTLGNRLLLSLNDISILTILRICLLNNDKYLLRPSA